MVEIDRKSEHKKGDTQEVGKTKLSLKKKSAVQVPDKACTVKQWTKKTLLKNKNRLNLATCMTGLPGTVATSPVSRFN